MWLLMSLVVYLFIGAIVWMAEDIRGNYPNWAEFLAWPIVVIIWGDELSEWIQKIMKDRFGDG